MHLLLLLCLAATPVSAIAMHARTQAALRVHTTAAARAGPVRVAVEPWLYQDVVIYDRMMEERMCELQAAKGDVEAQLAASQAEAAKQLRAATEAAHEREKTLVAEAETWCAMPTEHAVTVESDLRSQIVVLQAEVSRLSEEREQMQATLDKAFDVWKEVSNELHVAEIMSTTYLEALDIMTEVAATVTEAAVETFTDTPTSNA